MADMTRRAASTVVVDADHHGLATMLEAEVGARVHPAAITNPHDAMALAGSLAPSVVVVARSQSPMVQSARMGQVDVVDALVQPVRWWLRAAMVTRAFVVMVSDAEVFTPAGAAPVGRATFDEYALRQPVTVRGRALRTAEVLVERAGGAIVRGAGVGGGDTDTDELEGLAALVAWVVAGRHGGTWHVDTPLLDATFTRLAMADRPLGEAGGNRDA